MTHYKILLINIFVSVAICGSTNSQDTGSLHSASYHAHNLIRASKVPSDIAEVKEKVKIEVYYESLCRYSRSFIVSQLKSAVERLGSYLDIRLLPYGKAQTIDYGNGTYAFNCQHGPKECYGNKLHACDIDYLGTVTRAIFFNSCMMDFSQNGNGSDDEAADKCGKSLKIDTEAIKQCAKGPQGTTLLKYYGDESKKVHYDHIPYVLINGVKKRHDSNFIKDVCAAFKTPPPRTGVCAHKLKDN